MPMQSNMSHSGDAEEAATSGTGLISTLITEAADGVLATNTLKRVISAFEDFMQEECTVFDAEETHRNRLRSAGLQPVEPSKFSDFEDAELSRLLSYLPLQEKKTARLVCHRWKRILDRIHLCFHRRLNRHTVHHLKGCQNVEKLTIYDILDIKLDDLNQLKILETVKEIEFEDSSKNLENPTIGEDNLIAILKMACNVEQLVFQRKSLGNFGLKVLEDKKCHDHNEIIVGWQWPEIKMPESMSTVTQYLCKILGDFDETLDMVNGMDFDPENEFGYAVPSDPPGLEVTYKSDPLPPFPAFISLASVRLEKLEKLAITVEPVQTAEKLGLIALLHVVTFPSLRTFSVDLPDYAPDEALYRCVFRFIAKHQNSLRHLTFINPALSTTMTPSPRILQNCIGLEKVKLRSLTVAWEVPIGLELYWEYGHYLIECQRRLSKLEFHTTSVQKVEAVIANNFRYLTEANIDISDTGDEEFNCDCFAHCAKLRTLVLRVSISVKIVNVNKLPDTIHTLHWDAMYTREDVRWFSRFLVLARAVYLYHDKDIPMDIFAPFTFADFVHFVRLPCLEQLYLPRIHIQDPRVNRFCDRHLDGLKQSKDFFLIDRRRFKFKDAFAQYSVSKTDTVNNNFL